MAEDSDDRTEAATPRRLQRAHEEGQVPISREVWLAAGLAAAALMLMLAAPSTAFHMTLVLGDVLARAGRDDPVTTLRAGLWLVATSALPFLGVAFVATVFAGLVQTGGAMNPKALQLSFARLNPAQAISRVAAGATLGVAVQALAKLLVVAAALAFAMRNISAEIMGTAAWSPGLMLDRVLHAAQRMMLVILAAQIVIAAIDVVRTRLSFARRLRMTRHELREEVKESEGDPHLKQRVRRVRQQRARRRMMAAVPKATVVVTNPTHYAVALSYDRGSQGAPRVVAKGSDALAQRIRDLARESVVPIVCNPPLARALYQVELDAEIPVEMFQAVAEVIAVVWRLRTPRRPGAG